MDAEKSVSVNKSAQKNVVLASAQGGKKQGVAPLQGQRNDAPVTQVRSSSPASLLGAASPPADRVAIIDGYSVTTSVGASYPNTTTTTTNTTATTVTSITTMAPQPRVVLLQMEGDALPPVWEHYANCAMLIHSTIFNDTCGSELVSQVARIPCTTNFYPVDDAFIDGFIAVVKGTFASDEGMEALDKEKQSWSDFQARAPASVQEKLSVWIRLFNCALMVAKTLHKEGFQAGVQDIAGKLNKLRSPIDGIRRQLARIHLGDRSGQDTSWMVEPGNASSRPKGHATSRQHQRTGSMTALFPGASPEGGKKTLPRLSREELAGFASKEKALLGWKKKADKHFDKHHVNRSVLIFFEQCLEAVMKDWPDLYCIAYKFVASIRFAEAARGIDVREALVEETDEELGYVNEILTFCAKLKAIVRSDSGALPEERAYCRMWLEFFQQVGVLMDFRRSNPETALSESPEMIETLVGCEIAYENVVRKMREADGLRQKQEEEAQARQKSARAKERRLKGRSMDFLMPRKEKRAAQPAVTRDTDAIGLSPRKKIAGQGKQREDIWDEDLPVKTKAGRDAAVLQDKKSARKNVPVAESLPDSEHSATSPVTSPSTSSGSVSKPKKKSATFEAAQQEAGPARAAEQKKAKSKGTRQEQERPADLRELGEGDKPKKGGKEKKEGKEEKMEKTPGKSSKGAKDD
ncbi:MAG: hypothetical protein ACJ8G3_01430 [Burkholderiaceae bacterium]